MNLNWISVKDSLPKLNEEVLVCEYNGDKPEVTTMASLVKESWMREAEWRVRVNCGGWEYEVDPCEPCYWCRVDPPK